MKKIILVVIIILLSCSLIIVNLFLNRSNITPNNDVVSSSNDDKESNDNNEITKIIEPYEMTEDDVNEPQEFEEYLPIVEEDDFNEELMVEKIKETEEEFYEIINSNQKVVIDFYADWCVPCRFMEPIFNEVATENQDMVFYRVNADYTDEVAVKYNIMYLPSIIVFENGEEVDRSIGQISKEQLIELIS